MLSNWRFRCLFAMYSVFQKKLGLITLLINLIVFLIHDVFAGPTLLHFINFEFVTLQSKHNSMKKETKILKY